MMCSIILLKEQVKQPLKRRRRIKLTMKIPQIILRKKITTVTVEKKETYSTSASKPVDGSITIALEITNNAAKTLETYPNQGQLEANKLDLNGGDAVLSNFDTTEIKPGETAKGKIIFPVDDLDKVSDITWISYSFLSYLKDSSTPITTETGKIELK